MTSTELSYLAANWMRQNPRGTGESEANYFGRLAEYFYDKGHDDGHAEGWDDGAAKTYEDLRA